MIKHTAFALALLAAASAPAAAASENENLVDFQSLAPGLAVELAQATMKACEEKGYQVSVAVVDRFGVPQVMLRDRFAGPHTPDTAVSKAYTAVSFRTDTLSLVEPTQSGKPQSGARSIPDVVMLGGGELVSAGGRLVAGVGVSGAPSGEADAACAKAGIEAVESKLLF
jgi:uncharacterized protein GlcG (DUF336 family)